MCVVKVGVECGLQSLIACLAFAQHTLRRHGLHTRAQEKNIFAANRILSHFSLLQLSPAPYFSAGYFMGLQNRFMIPS
jgi:hypothetical protein